MILLGITGPIGHGKSSFADALAKAEPSTVHLETSAVIIEIANAWQATLETPFDPYDINELNDWLRKLPELIENMLGVPCEFEQLRIDPDAVAEHPDEYQKLLLHAEDLQRDFTLAHQQITPTNKENYRPLLQWLGGYLVAHVDAGIWYNELVRRAQAAAADGAKLCAIGGVRYPSDADIVRAAGGKIVEIYRPGHLENDVLDPTERERSKIKAGITVVNDSTLAALEACTAVLLHDLQSGSLQTSYQASRYETH